MLLWDHDTLFVKLINLSFYEWGDTVVLPWWLATAPSFFKVNRQHLRSVRSKGMKDRLWLTESLQTTLYSTWWQVGPSLLVKDTETQMNTLNSSRLQVNPSTLDKHNEIRRLPFTLYDEMLTSPLNDAAKAISHLRWMIISHKLRRSLSSDQSL